MDMKKAISVAIALMLALSFFGCAKKEPSDEKQTLDSADLTKLTFALDWTQNTNHTGLYVAKAKGYFEEAGLDVDIVYVDGDSSTQLVASGRAQFGVEFQDTLAAALATEEPLGVTAVAAILQHNTSGIISRKGDGIDSPGGLSGKRYSTWDSPIELSMLRSLVNADGGNWDSVTLIPNNITDEAGALSADQTDAVWIFYGWSGVNAKLRGFDADFFFFKDLDPTFDYYTPVIIGNNEYMAEHPDTARAFVSAVSRGYTYAADHPEESAQILIESDDTGALAGDAELVRESQKWSSAE